MMHGLLRQLFFCIPCCFNGLAISTLVPHEARLYWSIIPSAHTTSEVDEYLANNFTIDNYDYLMYAAVNRSLDMTIHALGRERVEKELEKHRMLQKMAEEHCQAVAAFPFSHEGIPQAEASRESCYEEDCGCGYKCVQDVLQRYEYDQGAL
jgi:hypothetical protein